MNRYDVFCNNGIVYKYLSPNNKKVVDMWECGMLHCWRPRKRMKNQLKTKARSIMRLIYKMANILKSTLDIAIKFSHKLYWYSTTLQMSKLQNLIFPHLDPFFEPWSHMSMKARKCFIFYSKNFSKNWSLFNSYVNNNLYSHKPS